MTKAKNTLAAESRVSLLWGSENVPLLTALTSLEGPF